MLLDHREKAALESALNALANEEIFVYPTDTLYGFGGDARSENVMCKLFALKNRPEHMPVSMLVRDMNMLKSYAKVDQRAEILIDRFLPGPLTLILPACNTQLPSALFSVEGYLGFRIPDHAFCRELTSQFDGPVITTSVNTSGQPALNRMDDIQKAFGSQVDLLISDPMLDQMMENKGSTVLMLHEGGEIKVLREGAIAESEILKSLR